MRKSAASPASCWKSLPFGQKLDQIPLGNLAQRLAGVLVCTAFLITFAGCGGGGSSNNSPPPPTISSFAPTSGGAGTAVVITGTNLTGATAVMFNGRAAASFSVNSSTQITATVASNSSTGRITVATSGGTAFSSSNFTINSPTISSFNPTSGIVGTSVTITGTNFTGATAVKFNGAAASFSLDSDTQITATVAAGSSTGRISVTTANGTVTSSTNFAVILPPTISRVDPGSGPVGTPVVVRGTNFGGVTGVAINGIAANSLAILSDNQIIANVAAGTTSGKVTVTNLAGTAMSASNFTVTSGTDTLDLAIDGLYVTQATQDYPDPIVPLVQNRSAWVRVFVTANQTTAVTPQVKVDFINGATTNSFTIPAPSGAVPMSADVANASTSWNAAVDKSWIQPGTQVVATVDPTPGVIPEADETNNTFSQNLDVRNLKTWKVTLVPVKTKDGRQGGVGLPGQTPADWVDFARRIHPVADVIDVTIGSVWPSSVTTLQSDGTGWGTVLDEIEAKRTTDGATDRYYYGAVNVGYSSGVAGLGDLGFPAAIGWDSSRPDRGDFAQILAHEVGHNFNRKHSPCGGPDGVDPNYPYPGAIIGVPGWDIFASSNNLMPSSYLDVMSYCGPYWVSDYTYVGVLNFRATSGIGIIVPGANDAAVPPEGLLVWGRIEDGQVTLEPAFRIPVKNPEAQSGPYTWEARGADGRALASMSFSPHEVADLPGDRSLHLFSFAVPLDTHILNAVETMHVKLDGQELARRDVSAGTAADLQSSVRFQEGPNGKVEVVWDSTRYPVLMLRDANSGEVRGFLRDGYAEIEAAPREIEVRASDATRSEAIRYRRVAP